jgi:hypothetical protein
MERRKFIAQVGTGTLATCAAVPVIASNLENSGRNPGLPLLEKEEVQHMVIFDLKHQKGSAEAEKFLTDGRRILSKIPVVQNFQAFNQVSLKNDYSYGFSMVFKDQPAYATYNNHPDHVEFVENRWKKEVTRFLEIDFKAH